MPSTQQEIKMAKIINFNEYLNDLTEDTIEQVEIDKSMEVGQDIAFSLFTVQPDGTDNTGILFSIWSTLTVALMLRGWTANELRKEVTSNKKEAAIIAKDISEQTQE